MATHTLRENFWWYMAILALAAALLLGSVGKVQKYSGENGRQEADPTEYWNMWPTRPVR